MGSPEEQVLVVPRAALVPGEGWLGIRRDGLDDALDIVAREGFFMRRGDAEEDPTHKQVIRTSCCAMASAGSSCAGRAPAGTRASMTAGRSASAATSTRETSMWTAAFGGSGRRSSWRTSSPLHALLACSTTTRTAVGSVHVGFVYVADVGGRPVAIRETDKLEGAFVATAEVAAVRDDLETWSRLSSTR